jgi:hypothetical protein
MMRRKVGMIALGLLAAVCASGCAGGLSGPPQISDDFMKGGQYLEPWLGAALTEAAKHPLGTEKNPVRADMPEGQRAYLSRLRCGDGKAPTYRRVGNLGAGVFGSIVDSYDVRCAGSQPAQTFVVMDMYFSGYVETQPVAGFTIALSGKAKPGNEV